MHLWFLNPIWRRRSYHVALVHLGAHGELHDEPGGVPQDEGGDEVPVDDVPQAADAPARRAEGIRGRTLK